MMDYTIKLKGDFMNFINNLKLNKTIRKEIKLDEVIEYKKKLLNDELNKKSDVSNLFEKMFEL